MPGILIFMLISAVICGGIASSQRRSVPLAAVLGFIFPIIAIFFYAFIPDAKRICPKCGEPNAPTRHTCKECGQPLLDK